MSLHHIESACGGWQVYHYDGHGMKRLDGPVWPTGKQARAYVEALDIAFELQAAPDVSPSRREPAALAPGEVMELWGK